MGCGQSTEAANLQNEATNFLEQPKHLEDPNQNPFANSKPVIGTKPREHQDSIPNFQIQQRQKPVGNQGYPSSSQPRPSSKNGFGSPQIGSPQIKGNGSPPVKAYKPPISTNELASQGSTNSAQIAANARDATYNAGGGGRGFREESGGRPSIERVHDHKPASKPKRTQTRAESRSQNSSHSRPSPIESAVAQPSMPQRLSTLPPDIVIEEAKDGETFEQVYRPGKQLGEGAFSKVILGTHRLYEVDFAVKIIDRKKMHWGGRDALKDEIENLRKLKKAPNVVKFQDVFYEESLCYLVVELLPGGELFGRIIEKGTFSEREARDASKCVLSALHYMHLRRIVHRDMKPENLLLVVSGNYVDVYSFARNCLIFLRRTLLLRI